MKKKIIIFVLVTLLSGLTACGTGGDKPADPTGAANASDTTKPAETATAESSDNKKNNQSSVELPLTGKFPLVKLFIDGPSYQYIEKGYTNLYNVGGNRFIALTSNDSIKANKLSEVLEVYFDSFKSGVKTNCHNYDPVKFNIKESKEMNINGIDFWRFQGDLIGNNSVKDKNLYTVGYTFIKDNQPFQITGVVVSDEQDQKDKDEITTYVDAMVKTIRDKR